MSEVTITVVVGEDPETGVWCPRCALSTALRFPLTGITPYEVSDLGVLTICPECQTAEEVCAAWLRSSPP